MELGYYPYIILSNNIRWMDLDMFTSPWFFLIQLIVLIIHICIGTHHIDIIYHIYQYPWLWCAYPDFYSSYIPSDFLCIDDYGHMAHDIIFHIYSIKSLHTIYIYICLMWCSQYIMYITYICIHSHIYIYTYIFTYIYIYTHTHIISMKQSHFVTMFVPPIYHRYFQADGEF